MVTQIDHSMVSGDTATPLEFTVTNADGTARDLTGESVRYVVYHAATPDAAILLAKSTAAGSVVIVDAVAGSCRVPYEHDDTADIGNRVLPHEVEVTGIDGLVETVGKGGLQVTMDYAA